MPVLWVSSGGTLPTVEPPCDKLGPGHPALRQLGPPSYGTSSGRGHLNRHRVIRVIAQGQGPNPGFGGCKDTLKLRQPGSTPHQPPRSARPRTAMHVFCTSVPPSASRDEQVAGSGCTRCSTEGTRNSPRMTPRCPCMTPGCPHMMPRYLCPGAAVTRTTAGVAWDTDVHPPPASQGGSLRRLRGGGQGASCLFQLPGLQAPLGLWPLPLWSQDSLGSLSSPFSYWDPRHGH